MLERTAELETANRELTDAMANVKELSGLLPICGHCKKIRDDQDYWHTLEGYVSERSNARFTHGICPDCVEKYWKPNLDKLKKQKDGSS